MKLVAIMPVHNEDWVLGLSLRALLMWCDEAIVLLHACTDGSAEITRAVAKETGRVTILEDARPAWDEMPQRARLLAAARAAGSSHVVILDADEVLTGNLLKDIKGHVGRLAPRNVLELPGFNLRGGIDQYHASGIWGNRWFAAAFADDAKLNWAGDRFHHRHPMGPTVMRRFIGQSQGGIMHLWGASERRLRAKHARYKLTERLKWPTKSVGEIDRMYSLAVHGQPGDRPNQWRYAVVPESWWEPYADLMPHLDLDAMPLQEAECIELLRANPRLGAGLDLFGVETLCHAPAHAIA